MSASAFFPPPPAAKTGAQLSTPASRAVPPAFPACGGAGSAGLTHRSCVLSAVFALASSALAFGALSSASAAPAFGTNPCAGLDGWDDGWGIIPGQSYVSGYDFENGIVDHLVEPSAGGNSSTASTATRICQLEKAMEKTGARVLRADVSQRAAKVLGRQD